METRATFYWLVQTSSGFIPCLRLANHSTSTAVFQVGLGVSHVMLAWQVLRMQELGGHDSSLQVSMVKLGRPGDVLQDLQSLNGVPDMVMPSEVGGAEPV